jgi:hypothetical protein
MSRKILAAVVVTVALAASAAYAWAPLSCTPGFWKNWLLESHGPNAQLCPSPSFTFDCSSTTLGALLECGNEGTPVCTCTELVHLLSAEEGATLLERSAAQQCLNVVAQDQLGGVTIVCE